MHELGVLRNIARTVCRVAEQNGVKNIKYMTLEVGNSSEIVPEYLEKLYPIACENVPLLHNSTLKIEIVNGKSLIIKEIGY